MELTKLNVDDKTYPNILKNNPLTKFEFKANFMDNYPDNHSNRNPQNSNHRSSDDEEIPHKIPEYIIVEEDDGNPFHTFDPQTGMPQELAKIPFKIRILCFVIGIIALMWTVGALTVCLITSVFALVSFGQVSSLNRLVKNYWDSAKKGWVIALGLAIAVFSPYLGFALIVSYFAIIGQSSPPSGIQSVFNASFHDYMKKK